MPEIQHTSQQAQHPWPDGMFIQGGKSGVVLNGPDTYRTAFVEAFPDGTFLRGEGATVTEAEDACWAKYQALTACPAYPAHGPFEPRHFTNGAGFCTQCGGWFSKVCEPSLEHRLGEAACDIVQQRYGEGVVWLPQWQGLVADEKACLLAAINGEPDPAPTTTPPTAAELAEAGKPFSESDLTEVLTALAKKSEDPA